MAERRICRSFLLGILRRRKDKSLLAQRCMYVDPGLRDALLPYRISYFFSSFYFRIHHLFPLNSVRSDYYVSYDPEHNNEDKFAFESTVRGGTITNVRVIKRLSAHRCNRSGCRDVISHNGRAVCQTDNMPHSRLQGISVKDACSSHTV